MTTKKCFICKKVGCWSSKHPREERDEWRRKRNQEHRQYIIDDDDGIPDYNSEDHPNDGYPEDNNEYPEGTPETLIIEENQFTPFTPIPENTESFFATVGTLPRTTATSVAANLADRSFIHAITATTPEPTRESTISIYTSQVGTNSST